MPKLSVSLVAHGCYWRAGEDVPPEELPAFALKYVVPADDSDSSKSPQPAPPTQATGKGREACQTIGPLSCRPERSKARQHATVM